MARSEAINLVLDDLGVAPERYAIAWVSSAEAPRFAELVTKFTEQIRELGPNPARESKALAA